MSCFRDKLEELPLSERGEALDEFIYDHFRKALMLEPHEEVNFEESFFDLGMTSLTLSESKRVLEKELMGTIDAPLLFNHPTVPSLIKMLKKDILKELFEPTSDPVNNPENMDYNDIHHLMNKKFNL